MTETIGWGDVDVDPERIRRRGRWLRAAVALAVLAVAIGAVVTTLVRSNRTTSTVRFLQREWALQSAYDDSRQQLLTAVTEHVGLIDEPSFVQLTQALDRQERAKLLAIDAALARHGPGPADARRTRDVVRHSLHAEAADLDEEATLLGSVAPTQAAYVPSPFTEQTLLLIGQASTAVSQLAQRHHVKSATAPKVRLDAASAIAHRLMRITDRPLPIRLLIAGPTGFVVWDLRTGNRRTLPLSTDGILTVSPAGSAVLVRKNIGGFTLVPLDGSPPVTLPAVSAYVRDPAGRLWAVFGSDARQVSGTGHLVGDSHQMPVPYTAQDTDAIAPLVGVALIARTRALTQTGDQLDLLDALWRPDTGRTVPIGEACGTVSGGPLVAAYTSCAGPDLRIVDLRTGTIKRVGLAAGYQPASVPFVSPDGRRLAVTVLPDGSPDGQPAGIDVIDLATHRHTLVPFIGQIQPAAWSPDGDTLVVRLEAGNGLSQLQSFAYWQPGMTGLASLRIGTRTGENTAVVVP